MLVEGDRDGALTLALERPGLVVVTPDGDRFAGAAWRAGGPVAGATPGAVEDARRRAAEAAESRRSAETALEAARQALAEAQRWEAAGDKALDSHRARQAGLLAQKARLEGNGPKPRPNWRRSSTIPASWLPRPRRRPLAGPSWKRRGPPWRKPNGSSIKTSAPARRHSAPWRRRRRTWRPPGGITTGPWPPSRSAARVSSAIWPRSRLAWPATAKRARRPRSAGPSWSAGGGLRRPGGGGGGPDAGGR